MNQARSSLITRGKRYIAIALSVIRRKPKSQIMRKSWQLEKIHSLYCTLQSLYWPSLRVEQFWVHSKVKILFIVPTTQFSICHFFLSALIVWFVLFFVSSCFTWSQNVQLILPWYIDFFGSGLIKLPMRKITQTIQQQETFRPSWNCFVLLH